MGASTIAIRPLQDIQAKVGSGRLFDMGGSTVNYGIYMYMYVLPGVVWYIVHDHINKTTDSAHRQYLVQPSYKYEVHTPLTDSHSPLLGLCWSWEFR